MTRHLVTRIRELSIGSYLAIATTLVLAVVSTLLVLDLTSRGRTTALVAKQASAETVTALFAATISAAVVFDDSDGIDVELQNLRRADGVLAASLFTAKSVAPRASVVNGAAAAPAMRPPARVTTTRETMTVSREVLDREGIVVGAVVLVFSLADANRAQEATQRSLAFRGLVLVAVTATLLIVIARRKVIRPLSKLVGVANRIEHGDFDAASPEDDANAEIRTLAHAFDRMRGAIAEREKSLRTELEVAASLQVSVLPASPRVLGLDIAAYMEPASEVGGDYYDVIPTKDGCWFGIGDVTGHGLGAGVVMLMLQSAVGALVRARPDAPPSEIECLVNGVLYDNVRTRMKRRDHATLSLLRYTHDGRVRIAGAHEDLLVLRAATGKVERIETPGTWVGAVASIASATVDSELELQPDDVLVLYTDGITEARNGTEQFGLDRLCDVVESTAGKAAEAIKDAVVTAVHAWEPVRRDDISIVVLRRMPPETRIGEAA